LAVLAYQYSYDFGLTPFMIFLAATTGFFWLVLAVSLAIFLIVARNRKLVVWKRVAGGLALIVMAAVATGLWWFLFLEGPLFNLAAPLTHRYRVYPVECDGRVVAGNFCCGKLGVPLNPSTYTMAVSRQQVFESTLDIPTPLHNCEVRDYLDWVCTTYYDATGERETDMVHSMCFDRDYMVDGEINSVSSGPCPSDSVAMAAALEAAAKRDWVQVDSFDYWLGSDFGWWENHKGIWNEKGEFRRYLLPSSDPMCKNPSHWAPEGPPIPLTPAERSKR
jgi:hypothetical protein